MKYTFGPINSRRFGLSLGIDLSPKSKSCNFDCLYCELEASKAVDKITDPPKIEDIIKDVKSALLKFPDIEVITITSNGEPTLYQDLDDLVDKLNKIKFDKKLLILSNASTIYDKKIQNILKKIDIVKLSLDSAIESTFKKLDRPLHDIKLENIINGLIEFRKVYDKSLVIEILVVKNLNDTPKQMQELNRVLQKIKPNRVDLGTIDRPSAYHVEAVDTNTLKKLSKEFENLALSIIYKNRPKQKIDFTKEQILQTLKRRPQSLHDIEYLFSKKSKKNLQELIDNKKVVSTKIATLKFYILAS